MLETTEHADDVTTKEYKVFLKEIKDMVQFAKAYPDFTISQQPVGQIPWGHNILLLQKLTSIEERFGMQEKRSPMVGAEMHCGIG